MHEQILAGLIGRDEAKTLLVAEPLRGSCSHLVPLRGMCTAKRGGCSVATTAETRGTALAERMSDPYGKSSVRSGRKRSVDDAPGQTASGARRIAHATGCPASASHAPMLACAARPWL